MKIFYFIVITFIIDIRMLNTIILQKNTIQMSHKVNYPLVNVRKYRLKSIGSISCFMTYLRVSIF